MPTPVGQVSFLWARGSTGTVDCGPGAQMVAKSRCLFISQEKENMGGGNECLGTPNPSFPLEDMWQSLPEEDVPKKKPAGVEAQRQQWEEQGTIGVVLQHSLCQCRQEELPAFCE